MKKHKRNIILYPFSVLYGLITALRNVLFENEILKSTSFEVPVISVGNLAVGGTGKTPHTELILRSLLADWKVAVLSRGYKRKTRGFVLAGAEASSLTIGDEPYQIFWKFPEVAVAVCEKRVVGVRKMLERMPDMQVVVLDDAFQHRYIQPGFSILLTDFNNLYTRDTMLPAGSLREWQTGSKRADVIVVTKCPLELQPIEMRLIETELHPESNQQVFFSSYVYDQLEAVFPDQATKVLNAANLNGYSVLLVAGIVSPGAIVSYLQSFVGAVESMFYPDHYAFQANDFQLITRRLNALPEGDRLIVMTEKDAARVRSNSGFPDELKKYIYALPIRVKILHNQESLFIQKIRKYVVENSRNC